MLGDARGGGGGVDGVEIPAVWLKHEVHNTHSRTRLPLQVEGSLFPLWHFGIFESFKLDICVTALVVLRLY